MPSSYQDDKAAAPSDESAGNYKTSMSKLRVLVLENEPLIASLLVDWLDELGCEPIGPVAALPDALARIASESFDGAIVDVSLDGGEAYPCGDALLARGVPFAFTTGHDKGAVEDRFPGATVLSKPFDFNAVKTLVESWA